MKTKYVEVSTADRLPEKTNEYFTDKGKAIFGSVMNNWHVDKVRISPHWWLEEKPDYEEEMRGMLERIVGFASLGEKVPDHLTHEIEELLTKIKES